MAEKPTRTEFVVNEPEKLVKFYEIVFGWQVLVKNPYSGDWLINLRPPDPHRPALIAHIIEKEINIATSFIGNFAVDSLEQTTQRVLENDGHIYIEEGETRESDIIAVAGLGRQRYFCDPEGNMFGAVELENP